MKSCKKDYLSKLLGFTEEENKNEMIFKNKALEKDFNKYKLEKELQKSRSLTVFLCLPLLIFIIINLVVNKKPIRPTYFFIAGLFLDLLLSQIFKKYEDTYTKVMYLRYVRFYLIYFNIGINWIFPVNPNDENVLRYVYCLIFYINFLHNYFFYFNFYLLVIITTLNSAVIFFAQFKRGLTLTFLLPEIIINVLYYYVFYVLKKSELLIEKESFFEYYRNLNYIEYIQNLVNVLNTMIISVKNDEVLFINDYALNYLIMNERFFKLKNKDIQTKDSFRESENLISDGKIDSNNINFFINRLFDSLIMNSSSENSFENGGKFKEIIKKILSQDKFTSINFIKIGFFKFNYGKDSYFEIFARKLKYHEEALEILIYDITEIKQAEKYKQNLLAKIAHEFKTPLITIISLINKIMTNQNNIGIDEDIKNNLSHISNLSNYTLILINDIVQYVSDYVNLRLSISEINIKEIMDFSSNVLKTLVECNEKKSDKIKTEVTVDKYLESIMIFTDENRLKQILLNLISNAFKFTLFGYIKIKAKYLIDYNLVEFSVKDTGIGIKEEDQHLMFRENVQLSDGNEYNINGSGLGLSIVKNLAKSLNYKFGFSSIYGKGSKFYIRIPCTKSIRKNKGKTISFNKSNSKFNKLNIRHNSLSNSFVNSSINISQREIILISHNGLQTNIEGLEADETYSKNFYPAKINEEVSIKSYRDIKGFDIVIDNEVKEWDIKKIVIVDDHKLVREHIVNLINIILKQHEKSQFEIIECSDGIELLYIIKNDIDRKIKLILIDENMEYLNGSDTVLIIRKLEEKKIVSNYYIVSITAFENNEMKDRIMRSGADSIISKPCSKSDLLKIFLEKVFP